VTDHRGSYGNSEHYGFSAIHDLIDGVKDVRFLAVDTGIGELYVIVL
jgi:hypothetical protein